MQKWSKHLWKIIGFSILIVLPLFLCFYILQTDQRSQHLTEQNNKNEGQEKVTTQETTNKGKNKQQNDENKEGGNSETENKEAKSEREGKEEKKVPELVWGVDSASLTDDSLLACVKENFGDPAVWGRYLGNKDNVSKGLTKGEQELLSKNGIKVLLISNQFTDATTYENGKAEAEEAISLAKEVNAPEGKAIFADIEPDYPVDENFIVGWHEVISSRGYKPGIYGIFSKEEALFTAFNAAAEQKADIKESTLIWTAAPSIEITSKDNAPEFKPEGPSNSLLYGWQYGIDAQACNIDTNLFKGELLESLW